MNTTRVASLFLLFALVIQCTVPVQADWLEVPDGRRVSGQDSIEVINLLDGTLKFALWAAGRDDLACRVRGVAKKQGPGVYLYEEASSQCVLRIFAQADRLVAEDQGDNCRTLYCPQTASIGVRSFVLGKPMPLTGQINEGW
ncbi:hypothetical protein [Pseudomonas turukhanskensis]|uniref:Uncharacterized protein n=1 Tax=Pseudomonas turukhanskensis TaxID=1806536 RepID=A0A9W6K5C3_9PSED|nr:hypothetical protein [Pseudomonas turukhanskensis]GLK89805.1 hypothetical protein GCM10017655_28670 [Pseudomonas turukhanskensis]